MTSAPRTEPVAEAHAGSEDRFGYQWQRYDSLQASQEIQFQRWLPFLTPTDWRGLRFVDAGCGMGRNSVWPMRYGASQGLAIDVDARTLAAARRTLEVHEAVQVRELSIYDLPTIELEPVDLAFSIGVIHHLEDPAAAIRALASVTRSGGRVCIWVYGYENNEWIVRLISPLRERLLSRLPMPLLHGATLPPTLGLWAALRLGLGRLEYFNLLRRLSLPQLRNIVLDQLLPKIAHYYRREEVEALMRQAGLQNIELRWVNEISWAASGIRP